MTRAVRRFAWSAIVVAVLAVGALLWSAPWLIGIGQASSEDLRTVSYRLTAKLPQMIDPETRLEQIEPGAGLEQVFRFRLVGKDAKDVDAASAIERLRERARAGICGQATLAPLVARGVRVTYVYVDRAGAEALRFSVDPIDCLWTRMRRAVGV